MTQKRIDFISLEEFQSLYKAEKNKQAKLSYLLGFGSGLRISEIIGFKRKFKMKKKQKLIDNSEILPLTKDKIDLKAHQIKIDNGKGKKWRITITSPLLNETMLNLLPINIKRRTLQARFERLSLKILNKRMSFHILRHGFGNYQANVLKVPLPIVQQMMGHSRLDTTGIYTKANPEESINNIWKIMTNDN